MTPGNGITRMTRIGESSIVSKVLVERRLAVGGKLRAPLPGKSLKGGRVAQHCSFDV